MTELKVPVPPTELEVKRIAESAGKPEGFRFPYASLVVRVAVMDEPEVRLALERLTTL